MSNPREPVEEMRCSRSDCPGTPLGAIECDECGQAAAFARDNAESDQRVAEAIEAIPGFALADVAKADVAERRKRSS